MTDLIQPPDPKEQPAQTPPVPKVSTPPCSVDRYLYSLFLQLGIPANKRGFHHLCVAVKLALENPELQHRLMYGLYPKVAEQLGTNVCCVERSIRTAITSAWSRGRPDLIEKQLGRGVITAYEKPTNGELISLVTENVRLLIQEGKL